MASTPPTSGQPSPVFDLSAPPTHPADQDWYVHLGGVAQGPIRGG